MQFSRYFTYVIECNVYNRNKYIYFTSAHINATNYILMYRNPVLHMWIYLL
jgi:hypothetical protein